MSNACGLALTTLELTQHGRVLIAAVTAPPYNFMTAQMQSDLAALAEAVAVDDGVGAVVITGGVAGRYITHFDIADILEAAQDAGDSISPGVLEGLMRGLDAAAAVPGAHRMLERTPLAGLMHVSRLRNLALAIMRSPAVWIAAIGGPCGGGGLELSAYFDVRIAADSGDVRFLLPELLIGLTTTVGGQRLAQLIGPARALEMLLEGRAYSAREALDMGLVAELVAPGELLDRALELGERYARRNRANVAAQKRIINEDFASSPAAGLRHEAAVNAAGVLDGPARAALREWVRMQENGGGDSVFLTDLEPWTRGEVVDLNPGSTS
ncbi:enoyl-CoA hydratase/isomerase family protein [Nocardia sp. NPDC003693]